MGSRINVARLSQAKSCNFFHCGNGLFCILDGAKAHAPQATGPGARPADADRLEAGAPEVLFKSLRAGLFGKCAGLDINRPAGRPRRSAVAASEGDVPPFYRG